MRREEGNALTRKKEKTGKDTIKKEIIKSHANELDKKEKGR